jgi:hypothetical protein
MTATELAGLALKAERARDKVEVPDFEGAMDLAEEVLAAIPGNRLAMEAAGLVLFYWQRWDEAAPYLHALADKSAQLLIVSALNDIFWAQDEERALGESEQQAEIAQAVPKLMAGLQQQLPQLESRRDWVQWDARVRFLRSLGYVSEGDRLYQQSHAARPKLPRRNRAEIPAPVRQARPPAKVRRH